MAADQDARSWAQSRIVAAVCLLAAGAIAYHGSLAVPFQFDDIPNIVDNANVHMTRFDGASLLRAVHGLDRGSRPLAYLSFALNHYLHGLDVFGFHLVNLIVHVACGFLVYLACLRWFALGAPRLNAAARGRTALAAALLFVVHPVQTQAVTYVVQRMTSLGSLFAFAAVLLYLQARTAPRRRSAWWIGALVSLALALLCKESFALLPIVVAIVDPVLFARARGGYPWRWVVALTAVLALLAAGAAVLTDVRPLLVQEFRRYPVSPLDHLMTESRIVFHYLSLLAYPAPSRLHVEYDYPLSTSLLSPPATLVAILGIAALAAIAIRVRRREPLVTFAVTWFLGNLLFESSVLPIDLVFEHRLYLPSAGLFLLGAYAVGRLAERVGVRAEWFFGPVLGLLVISTVARNHAWRDPKRLYQDAVLQAPGRPRVQLNLGWSCYREHDLACAEEAFRRVLALEPGNAGALNNLGNIARDRGDLDEAERRYRAALDRDPGFADALGGLAALHIQQRRWDDAETVLRHLLEVDPTHTGAHRTLGILDAQRGDLVRARAEFDRAIDHDPRDAVAHRLRARTFSAENRCADALPSYQRSLSLAPSDPVTLVEMGRCLASLGRPEQAIARLTAALRVDPRLPGVNAMLGDLLLERGDPAGAERHYRREIEIAPDDPAARSGLDRMVERNAQ